MELKRRNSKWEVIKFYMKKIFKYKENEVQSNLEHIFSIELFVMILNFNVYIKEWLFEISKYFLNRFLRPFRN